MFNASWTNIFAEELKIIKFNGLALVLGFRSQNEFI